MVNIGLDAIGCAEVIQFIGYTGIVHAVGMAGVGVDDIIEPRGIGVD